MKHLITLVLIIYSSLLSAQSINRNWGQDLKVDLSQFQSCESSNVIGINPCNAFIGKVLKTVYRVDDFYANEDGRYMLISEINDYLEHSNRWTYLGKGYEQDALEKAQKLANENKAVVAVYLNESNIGHLAYILPGDLQPSGSWGFQVPNSAALFASEPEKSYINKGLSYSFPRTKIKEVSLYARKY